MAKKLDLVAIGSANLDLIMFVDRFAKPDEELSAKHFRMEGGGSAANVAVGAARLGLQAGFLGNIGDDPLGVILKNSFNKEGVDISYLQKQNAPTGIAVCIVDQSGERSIYAYNETNLLFSRKNLKTDYISRSKCIYVSSMQGESAFKAIITATSIASHNSVPVYFDPGCILTEKGLHGLQEILSKTTILKLNREESEMLTGSSLLANSSKKILSYGPQIILITLGEKGCYLRTPSLCKTIPAYHTFKAVDKTGAGDSFNSAFINGFIKGWNLEECVKFGNLVAGISVTHIGARSCPTLEELTQYEESTQFREGN